jgi:hypothetical protein
MPSPATRGHLIVPINQQHSLERHLPPPSGTLNHRINAITHRFFPLLCGLGSGMISAAVTGILHTDIFVSIVTTIMATALGILTGLFATKNLCH